MINHANVVLKGGIVYLTKQSNRARGRSNFEAKIYD